MDLLANNAGDLLVGIWIAFIGGKALNLVARIRATIQKRWHLIGR